MENTFISPKHLVHGRVDEMTKRRLFESIGPEDKWMARFNVISVHDENSVVYYDFELSLVSTTMFEVVVNELYSRSGCKRLFCSKSWEPLIRAKLYLCCCCLLLCDAEEKVDTYISEAFRAAETRIRLDEKKKLCFFLPHSTSRQLFDAR